MNQWEFFSKLHENGDLVKEIPIISLLSVVDNRFDLLMKRWIQKNLIDKQGGAERRKSGEFVQ